MTTVPLTVPGGDSDTSDSGGEPAGVAGAPAPAEDSVASAPEPPQATAPGEVRGIGDLAQRIVTATYLGHPRLHKVLVVVVCVLSATCLAAVATRLSAWPLMPLPAFVVSAFALRRIRTTAQDHRRLLAWSTLFVAATLLGFWLMSVAARLVTAS